MLSAEGATRLADPVVIGRWAGAWRLGALALDPVGALDRYFAPLGGAIEITRTGSGPRRLLMMHDPQYNRQFLMNSKAMLTSGIWPLSAPPGSAQKNLRSHPLRTHGSEQANFDALIDPFLNRSTINQHFATIRVQVVAEVDRWGPGVHDFYRLARRCTGTVAFSLLFGEHEHARFAGFGDLLHEYHRAIWTRAAQAFPINLPGTPYHAALCRAEAVQRYIYDWMGAPDQLGARDFAFQRFAAARGADGCPFGQPRIAAAVAMLSWLSYETMASALSWLVFLLAQHPATLSDLIDELSAQDAIEDIDADTLLSLPLLDAVIKESMRLITPVPLVSFRMAQDGEIGDQSFARGSRFYVSPHLTHRLPELYPAPDRYRPGRWFSIKPTAYEYLPFGAGQRRCPGAWLATTNLKVTLAALLARYRPSTPVGARIDRMYAVVTMPKGGMPIELSPRDRTAPSGDGAARGTIFDLFTPEPGRPVR